MSADYWRHRRLRSLHMSAGAMSSQLDALDNLMAFVRREGRRPLGVVRLQRLRTPWGLMYDAGVSTSEIPSDPNPMPRFDLFASLRGQG